MLRFQGCGPKTINQHSFLILKLAELLICGTLHQKDNATVISDRL